MIGSQLVARRYIFFLATLIAAGGALHAQTESGGVEMASSFLTLGPAVAGGASMSLYPPEGLKVAPTSAYRFGAEMVYPLTDVIGGTMGLGYDSRAIRLRSLNSADIYQTTRVGYFSMMPGVHFNAFWLGLNIGLPLGASLTRQMGTGMPASTTAMSDEDFKQVEVLVEPRIGVLVPVYQSGSGWLGISFSAGISLNDFLYRDDLPVNPDHELGNYQIVSALLGITYQFAIPGTSR